MGPAEGGFGPHSRRACQIGPLRRTPDRTGIWPKSAVFGPRKAVLGQLLDGFAGFDRCAENAKPHWYLAEKRSYWASGRRFWARFYSGLPVSTAAPKTLNRTGTWRERALSGRAEGGFGPDSRSVYQIGPFRARFHSGLPVWTVAPRTPNHAGIWPKNAPSWPAEGGFWPDSRRVCRFRPLRRKRQTALVSGRKALDRKSVV